MLQILKRIRYPPKGHPMNPQYDPTRTSPPARTWILGKVAIALLVSLPAGATACGDLDSPNGQTKDLPAEQPNTAGEDTKPYTPKPTDFKLKVRIVEKECFGSAGCLISYRIKPSYSGDDIDGSFDIVYEVHGVKNGPAVNTFTLRGDEYTVDREEHAQTPSSGTKITAKVTEVEES